MFFQKRVTKSHNITIFSAFFSFYEKTLSPSCSISPQKALKFVLAFYNCTCGPNSHVMDVPWTFVTTCEQMFFNCKFMCTLAKFIRMKGSRNHSFCGFSVSSIKKI
jgi:hypothetical protein